MFEEKLKERKLTDKIVFNKKTKEKIRTMQL